jgi:quinol monooxygenase YgiN
VSTARNDVAWLLEMEVRDGRTDEVRALAAEMIRAARDTEPGAVDNEWSIGEDGRTVHIWERFADSASTLTHLGNFGTRFMARFLELMEPKRLTVYGAPSDEVRGALAPFGAVVLAPAGGFRR